MAAQNKEQKETVERVMHEFKHGELETSAGKKVKNPKQAIAIGLRETGASKYESDEKNEENPQAHQGARAPGRRPPRTRRKAAAKARANRTRLPPRTPTRPRPSSTQEAKGKGYPPS